MRTDGSAALAVVLLTSTLVILGMNLWYTSCLIGSIAVKRVQYEQMFKLTEGLLHYGIAYAIQHKTNVPTKICLDEWPPHDKKYHGSIVYKKKEKGVMIRVTLYDENQSHGSLQCFLVCNENYDQVTYCINKWRIMKRS